MRSACLFFFFFLLLFCFAAVVVVPLFSFSCFLPRLPPPPPHSPPFSFFFPPFSCSLFVFCSLLLRIRVLISILHLAFLLVLRPPPPQQTQPSRCSCCLPFFSFLNRLFIFLLLALLVVCLFVCLVGRFFLPALLPFPPSSFLHTHLSAFLFPSQAIHPSQNNKQQTTNKNKHALSSPPFPPHARHDTHIPFVVATTTTIIMSSHRLISKARLLKRAAQHQRHLMMLPQQQQQQQQRRAFSNRTRAVLGAVSRTRPSRAAKPALKAQLNPTTATAASAAATDLASKRSGAAANQTRGSQALRTTTRYDHSMLHSPSNWQAVVFDKVRCSQVRAHVFVFVLVFVLVFNRLSCSLLRPGFHSAFSSLLPSLPLCVRTEPLWTSALPTLSGAESLAPTMKSTAVPRPHNGASSAPTHKQNKREKRQRVRGENHPPFLPHPLFLTHSPSCNLADCLRCCGSTPRMASPTATASWPCALGTKSTTPFLAR